MLQQVKPSIWLAVGFFLSVVLGGCTMNTEIKAPPNKRLLASYEGKVSDNETTQMTKRVFNLNTHNTGKGVPLILPPEIRPLWIVDHVNSKGDLIRGHWVFVKIRNSMWYIQAITRKDFKDIIREMTSESQ